MGKQKGQTYRKAEDITQCLYGLLSKEEKAQADTLMKENPYPFNQPSSVIVPLALQGGHITFEAYQELVKSYSKKNIYLEAFLHADPQSFGEKFAERHLQKVIRGIKNPLKDRPAGFDGEYDLYLKHKGQIIRLESKACRALEKKTGQFADRALFADEEGDNGYASFYQVKPECSHVFIFWRIYADKIRYFVMSSEEVKNSPYLFRQHRGGRVNEDGSLYEGQISSKISNLLQYEVLEKDLKTTIINKYLALFPEAQPVAA